MLYNKHVLCFYSSLDYFSLVSRKTKFTICDCYLIFSCFGIQCTLYIHWCATFFVTLNLRWQMTIILLVVPYLLLFFFFAQFFFRVCSIFRFYSLYMNLCCLEYTTLYVFLHACDSQSYWMNVLNSIQCLFQLMVRPVHWTFILTHFDNIRRFREFFSLSLRISKNYHLGKNRVHS